MRHFLKCRSGSRWAAHMCSQDSQRNHSSSLCGTVGGSGAHLSLLHRGHRLPVSLIGTGYLDTLEPGRTIDQSTLGRQRSVVSCGRAAQWIRAWVFNVEGFCRRRSSANSRSGLQPCGSSGLICSADRRLSSQSSVIAPCAAFGVRRPERGDRPV